MFVFFYSFPYIHAFVSQLSVSRLFGPLPGGENVTPPCLNSGDHSAIENAIAKSNKSEGFVLNSIFCDSLRSIADLAGSESDLSLGHSPGAYSNG